MATGTSNRSKKPDFSKPKCNVQGFSNTGDYESWLHPYLHKFCHGIVAKLYQTNSNRNFLMSPVTCYITVGMLCAGARGTTPHHTTPHHTHTSHHTPHLGGGGELVREDRPLMQVRKESCQKASFVGSQDPLQNF